MFDFFKKKKSVTAEKVEIALSQEEIAAIEAQVQPLEAEIEALSDSDKGPLAEKYEQLGLLFAQLQQTDQAITSLEQSLAYQQSIGDGYKKLMSLYNQKRASAAQSGDGEGIDKWMNKMDEMRQIAKKVTVSRK